MAQSRFALLLDNVESSSAAPPGDDSWSLSVGIYDGAVLGWGGMTRMKRPV